MSAIPARQAHSSWELLLQHANEEIDQVIPIIQKSTEELTRDNEELQRAIDSVTYSFSEQMRKWFGNDRKEIDPTLSGRWVSRLVDRHCTIEQDVARIKSVIQKSFWISGLGVCQNGKFFDHTIVGWHEILKIKAPPAWSSYAARFQQEVNSIRQIVWKIEESGLKNKDKIKEVAIPFLKQANLFYRKMEILFQRQPVVDFPPLALQQVISYIPHEVQVRLAAEKANSLTRQFEVDSIDLHARPNVHQTLQHYLAPALAAPGLLTIEVPEDAFFQEWEQIGIQFDKSREAMEQRVKEAEKETPKLPLDRAPS
ncbi:MAG: hypothetical protein KGJ02_07310 [Verrucomicrobiota bacterium]|nr:hypothetical protein [Verrucomicrobiota bacterium]